MTSEVHHAATGVQDMELLPTTSVAAHAYVAVVILDVTSCVHVLDEDLAVLSDLRDAWVRLDDLPCIPRTASSAPVVPLVAPAIHSQDPPTALMVGQVEVVSELDPHGRSVIVDPNSMDTFGKGQKICFPLQ